MTIAEYPEFVARCDQYFSEEEREKLIDHLTADPKSGKQIQGTGGLRLLKWPAAKGKHTSCMIGYYYAGGKHPVQLINIFREGEKNVLPKLIRTLIDA